VNARVTANSFLSPLSDFYDALELRLPSIRRVDPCELPQQERNLLVHDRDMTPTLEAAHGGKLRLRVLRYAASKETVDRLVALVLDDLVTAVEMGAIRIFLRNLPPAAREAVLERRKPFGTILEESEVAHYSRPLGYFQVLSDSLIMEALGMRLPRVLHGRRNTIWSSSGLELATVVEILPPSKLN
jgi:chorismate-pyruvate lyase